MQGWHFPEQLQPVAVRLARRGLAFFHGELDLDRLIDDEELIVKRIKAPVGVVRYWQVIEGGADSSAADLQA